MMPKVKNPLFVFLLLIISLQVAAQKKKETLEKVGAFSTTDNDTTYMYNPVKMTPESISYSNADGKWKTEIQNKIKWMIVYQRVFLRLPRKSNGKDLYLMEVLAVNSNYILVQYWYEWYHYFVFDHKGNMIMEELKVFDRGKTINSEKNNRKAFDALQQYFGNCSELLNAMTSNINEKKIMSEGIANVQCDGAVDLEYILKELKNTTWYK